MDETDEAFHWLEPARKSRFSGMPWIADFRGATRICSHPCATTGGSRTLHGRSGSRLLTVSQSHSGCSNNRCPAASWVAPAAIAISLVGLRFDGLSPLRAGAHSACFARNRRCQPRLECSARVAMARSARRASFTDWSSTVLIGILSPNATGEVVLGPHLRGSPRT